MEQTILEQMYTIPSDELVATCTITEEAVEGTGLPILTYHDEPVEKKPVSKKHKKKIDNTNEIA